MYQILSAILNMGNIEFTAITSQHQTDKSEVPNSEALENGEMEHKGDPGFSLRLTKFLGFHNPVLFMPLPQKGEKKRNLDSKISSATQEWSAGAILILCFLLSGVSPQHRLGGAPGGSDLPVCGHQRRDHHPHQHCGQSRRRAGRHVQGLVRPAVQLDRQPHQHPAAA